MTVKFRQAALNKISNPDQLDQALRIIHPAQKLGLAIIAAVMVAGITWSILATAPEKVIGQGILLSTAGVAAVTAPDSGRIESLLVQTGDTVAAGQPVAIIRRPDLLDRLNAAENEMIGVRDQIDMLKGLFDANTELQEELHAKRRRSLTDRASTLAQQRNSLVERRGNEEELRQRGFTSALRVMETTTRIAEVENELASVRDSLTDLDVQRSAEVLQRKREISDAELRLEALRREAENRRREYERDRTAYAAAAGTVVEISVNPGDPVASGGPIMRLLPADEAGGMLSAIAFVPDTEGKKIHPGMAVQITPSTVKAQKDGFIRGTVTKIAELPSSREGMMRRLKNAAVVDQLLRPGPPFEVEIEMQRSAATPSGYSWSSGRGPDISVDAGTTAQVAVVVDRTRIISLALPAFDYVFLWLKSQ